MFKDSTNTLNTLKDAHKKVVNGSSTVTVKKKANKENSNVYIPKLQIDGKSLRSLQVINNTSSAHVTKQIVNLSDEEESLIECNRFKS